MADISPEQTLERVASAIPARIRKHITIVGSLAAGYVLRTKITPGTVRTKDIDCVLSPFAQATISGTSITTTLLNAGWTLRPDSEFPEPGNKETDLDKLPVVRLYPPESSDWFVELLSVPESNSGEFERFRRLEVDAKRHFVLPSFKFLPIAIYEPIATSVGISCARVEMMALANLLENPTIQQTPMRGLISNRIIKRGNKDIGRAVALARICDDEIETWPELWLKALRTVFPENWLKYAVHVGDGIQQLVENEGDLEQACHTCNNGLLSFAPVTVEQFAVSIKRFQKDCIEPFIELCSRE
ncbi:MAG: hypothetical protein IPH59_09625 [bacterium]|nr:hypothetical protein [bacterium]